MSQQPQGPPGATHMHTVVVQQFRDNPVQIICPSCQSEVVTTLSHQTGTLTWLICGGLCIFGCALGCCLIPFCVDAAKDVVHSCPRCHHVISSWKRV